ncbi:hypothetical protein [Leifsonia sp. AG29]|uniref:hypothetical protein n=1 Tax=Leifsonia sp. AG29 TaxID=2598860 RepID=UPI00131BE6CB|nr:hypothetical protein [Leifsonia sp. AG29]
MRKLVYAGTTFYTGDEIALALLEYARGLAREGVAETVFIPGRTETGNRDQIEVIIGPASQIVSEPADLDEPDISDPALVAEFKRRAAELAPRRPQAEKSGGTQSHVDD